MRNQNECSPPKKNILLFSLAKEKKRDYQYTVDNQLLFIKILFLIALTKKEAKAISLQFCTLHAYLLRYGF
jgi:hypothetical protein